METATYIVGLSGGSTIILTATVDDMDKFIRNFEDNPNGMFSFMGADGAEVNVNKAHVAYIQKQR